MMDEKKVFCEECRRDVSFVVREEQQEGRLKGKSYFYQGKAAYCSDCGAEIYVAEVNDYNLKALYDVYREKEGIISLEAIQAVPKKYAIGKRPLSLLLGWGEQTFSRYCDGDMPTKQYSETLLRIYQDPHSYEAVLEGNKSSLKPTAYEKSRRAVDALLGAEKGIGSKMNLVIEYLLNQCEDITPLALQKALYYVQGFYYAFYGKFIFHEDCEAWVHGPVYKDIYIRYREYRFDPITGKKEFDSSVFSPSEKAVFDSVVKHICCYSGKILEQFTHAETPWICTRGELPAAAASARVIEKEQIGAYFSEVKQKYHMINPNDIKGYAQRMFAQI